MKKYLVPVWRYVVYKDGREGISNIKLKLNEELKFFAHKGHFYNEKYPLYVLILENNSKCFYRIDKEINETEEYVLTIKESRKFYEPSYEVYIKNKDKKVFNKEIMLVQYQTKEEYIKHREEIAEFEYDRFI